MDVTDRSCGDCSLCCTVLRVDDLQKLGGVSCLHQNESGPGCSIHARRPEICRGYRCLWLQGGLPEESRPDRLGAVLDIVHDGAQARLEIRQVRPSCFDASPELAEIATRYRASMPVRITDVEEVMEADRAYLVLLPGGEEHRVCGEWTEIHRPGQPVEKRRLSLIERWVRRGMLGWQRLRLRRAGKTGPTSAL